jgi:hypothetical protein
METLEFLEVRNGKIVGARSGREIRLRGTNIGGWLNMENFINGYAGTDQTVRHAMKEALGEAKAHFFFERMLDYFFTEDDVLFLKENGLNCVRLPNNYRRFEDDERPYVYKEEGFRRLDEALRLCEKHGIYAILDMHAVQGFQNTHWHSDNAARHSFFWHDATCQDRFYALWRALAERYRDRAVVAGYDLMNEPCTNTPYGDYPHTFYANYKPDWERMNRIYRKAVAEIRSVDPKHIIFLEGDRYAYRFGGLEAPFAENLAYQSHNYHAAGFGPGPYPGVIRPNNPDAVQGIYWDMEQQRKAFLEHEGTVFAKKHNVPLLVGEFGSVYNGPAEEVPDRLRSMDDQIAVFEENGAHWTTWTYKDVGVMGLVTLNPESEYMQRIASFLEKKYLLGTDDWMQWLPAAAARQMVSGVAEYLREVIDPTIHSGFNRRALMQHVLCVYAATLLEPEYAKVFKGLPEEKLDEILQSFSFKQCVVNRDLAGILRKHAGAE